jgi:5-methylthioadenosine/S-adenosylhomocysteine deaminase
VTEPLKSSISLINGIILTRPGCSDAAPNARTTITGNRLLEVNVSQRPATESEDVIDCSGCLIIPGLINGHCHAAMSLLRGIADDLPLELWLNNYIFPIESNYVSREFVFLGSLLSAVEMVLSGVTTFADGYYFMEQTAQAAVKVGIRCVAAQGVLDVPTPDAKLPGSSMERAMEFLNSYPRHPLITPALFCHSPYLCSPETFKKTAELARKNNLTLFCHVAETQWEVGDILSRYGARPFEHLEALGILDNSFVGVHAIHLSDNEKQILARTKAGVTHCPESNMKLASGAAPVSELISLGIVCGLGTDGPACNNNLDMIEEMRSASLMSKLVTMNPESLGVREVIRMATIDNAKLLGMEDSLGSLEPGKLADITIVDLNKPHLTPLYDPVSHLVYSSRGSDVRHVIINGKVVVRNGNITTVDDGEIMAAAKAESRRIRSGLGLKYCGDMN